MDITGDKILPDNIRERVETSRFGPFIFQVGVDDPKNWPQNLLDNITRYT